MLPCPFTRRMQARKLAVELMARHGLHDWTFAFNHGRQMMGLCRYAKKRIELSAHMVERNGEDEVRDTILHEIAHALVGPSHGHDEVWKRKCIEIGAQPERCGAADMPKGRWQSCCAGCETVFHRHRRPARAEGWFCKSCGPVAGKLVWRPTVSR